MDSVDVEMPEPFWRSQLDYVANALRNTTRWALACPRPEKKSNPFIFAAQEEPEIEESWYRIVSESVTTTVVHIVAAAFLLYVIDYFVQLIYSLAVALSESDHVAPPLLPPVSLHRPDSSSPPAEPREEVPAHTLKMNQPKGCACGRTPSKTNSLSSELMNNSEISSTTVSSDVSSTKATGSASSEKTSSSESSNSTSTPEPRLPAGSDAAVAQNDFSDFDRDVPVATVFGGPRDDGKLETVGSFELEKPGKVFFIWMQRNVDVSITGSFFGYMVSAPLQKEMNWCSFAMTMPVGSYDYEFVVKKRSSSEE